MRWFAASFRAHLQEVERRTGARLDLDARRLAQAYVDWIRAFEAQRPGLPDRAARRAFTGFAAGLMLDALVRHAPVTVRAAPGPHARGPAAFWPEGYAYVTFCLAVRAAVLAQEFDEAEHETPLVDDLRSWWSFRETVAEDPSLAAAFLDLFAGEPPAWSRPRLFAPPPPAGLAAPEG